METHFVEESSFHVAVFGKIPGMRARFIAPWLDSTEKPVSYHCVNVVTMGYRR